MKEIAILLENREQDYAVGNFIKENLREVLEDTVRIRICFLEDKDEFHFSSVDLILVMVHRLIHAVYSQISDFYNKENILFVSRTLSREALDKINRIPCGERALVFNRSQYTTMETLRLLYQLDVMHLDLVPYGPTVDISEFKYIITPGAMDFIPECGGEIVNIGYRQLDCYSFLDIFSHLGISDDRINRNLFRYTEHLSAKHTDVEKWYLTTQMTCRTLENIMSRIDFGILVAEAGRRVIYYNRKIRGILRQDVREGELFEIKDNQEMTRQLFEEDFHSELIQIGEERVMVERYPLSDEDIAMGYYFEFQPVQNINNMGSRISEKLRKSGLYAKFTFRDIIYRSPEMKKCVDVAKKLARTEFSILVAGESGSGKELFAQSIHNASACSKGPFVAVNCAAFPENLLESELFGYEGGAFTGSRKEGKIGLFELANKGSIFLDEIGEMSYSLQSKLLRVLQEKRIMRVGGDHFIDIDIRVISASNRNLKEEVKEKHFRADLYYRLSTFTITIPPLRNRREDILPLFRTFCHSQPSLSSAEEEILRSYQWDGNVRELQNVAAYYDVIGNLELLSSPSGVPVSPLNAKEKIVDLLGRYPNEGLGRKRLINLLKEEGVPLSEGRFEALIRELIQENVISRGRGRQGIRLN